MELKLKFTREGVLLKQDVNWGLFGHETVTKTISYDSFTRLNLNMQVTKILPITEKQDSMDVLRAIELTCECADMQEATMINTKAKPSLDKQITRQPIHFRGTAPLMKQASATAKIFESETSWLTETQSGQKYLCVSKEKVSEIWKLLRNSLLKVGSLSYKEISKTITKEQTAWVSMEVFYYMGLITWEQSKNIGRHKTMISLTEKGKVTEYLPD